MIPTVFQGGGFRFYFFSREEPRMHVHGQHGEAKFWLQPKIEFAQNYSLAQKEFGEAVHLIKEPEHDIHSAPIGKILNVELPSPHHLYWPELDIDLALDSVFFPERFPLVSRFHPTSQSREHA